MKQTNDEQEAEFFNNQTAYKEGVKQGYAKALKKALAKHFEMSTISWVDWIKKEINK